jgi:hypothetical protein
MVQAVLYRQVVDVTNAYLGPASERFIARQIQNHLQKEPEELTREDLVKLVDWIKIAISLLTEDSKTVDDFTESLMSLTKK